MEHLRMDEPLLTRDDEIELARWMEAGLYAARLLATGRGHPGATTAELAEVARRGELARDRFVRANLRLVAKEARAAAQRTQLPPDELFQEGAVGLVLAVERYDHARDLRFATYALTWIRSRLGKAVLLRCGRLHLNEHGAEVRRLALVTTDRLAAGGRTPTTDEVAAALGRSPQLVRAALAHGEPASLTGADGTLLDRADPRAEQRIEAVTDAVARRSLSVGRLPRDQREVVVLLYGLADGRARGVTEVAARLRRSRTWVRRREDEALAALRAQASAPRPAAPVVPRAA